MINPSSPTQLICTGVSCRMLCNSSIFVPMGGVASDQVHLDLGILPYLDCIVAGLGLELGLCFI